MNYSLIIQVFYWGCILLSCVLQITIHEMMFFLNTLQANYHCTWNYNCVFIKDIERTLQANCYICALACFFFLFLSLFVVERVEVPVEVLDKPSPSHLPSPALSTYPPRPFFTDAAQLADVSSVTVTSIPNFFQFILLLNKCFKFFQIGIILFIMAGIHFGNHLNYIRMIYQWVLKFLAWPRKTSPKN